jgi:hypothetical protein
VRTVPILASVLAVAGLAAAGVLGARLLADDPANVPVRKILRERKVTVNFPAVPLADGLEFIRDVSGVDLVVDPAVLAPAPQVSVRLKAVPLEDAVALLAGASGLKIAARAPPGARLALRLKDARVATALEVICRLEGLRVESEGEGIVLTDR